MENSIKWGVGGPHSSLGRGLQAEGPQGQRPGGLKCDFAGFPSILLAPTSSAACPVLGWPWPSVLWHWQPQKLRGGEESSSVGAGRVLPHTCHTCCFTWRPQVLVEATTGGIVWDWNDLACHPLARRCEICPAVCRRRVPCDVTSSPLQALPSTSIRWGS